MIQLLWNSPTCVYIGQVSGKHASGNHIMRGSAVCFPSSYSAKISLHLHEGVRMCKIVTDFAYSHFYTLVHN